MHSGPTLLSQLQTLLDCLEEEYPKLLQQPNVPKARFSTVEKSLSGFKPCRMTFCPPPEDDPLAPWVVEILPCPLKPQKTAKIDNAPYDQSECTRPACKHWKPKGGPCLWDAPCKAHCFNYVTGTRTRLETRNLSKTR